MLGAGRYIPATGSSQPVSDVSMGGGSVDPFTGTRSNFIVKYHFRILLAVSSRYQAKQCTKIKT